MLFPRHIGVWAVLLACLVGSPAFGHDQESHQAALPSGAAAGVPLPFPVDIGGPFELTDQDRRTRRDSDFHGGYAMIFFGYATCKGICPVGMRRMVEAIDLLGEQGDAIQPILITVDPENDTPEALKATLPKIHPRLVGLTGSKADLASVAKAFGVQSQRVGQDISGDPVISHGSYSYLMGPDGKFLTLFPPILGSEGLAEKIKPYLE